MRVPRAIAAVGVAILVAFTVPQAARAVVGGTAAAPGSLPFMASLQTTDGFHFCGASVVSPWWVLTAAHCVDTVAENELRVVTGKTDLDSPGGQTHGVAIITIHPSPTADVALIGLSSPTSAPAIDLADWWDDDLEAAGTPVTVAGWGDMLPTQGLFSTRQLRQADLNVVSDDECGTTNVAFSASTGVCASYLLRDSCDGDSGGPLWGVKNNRRVQIGIVSYGYSCATPLIFPGVYAEVNNPGIRGFIRNNSGV